MKKVPAVLIMALITLPILAAPKPTPTPAVRAKNSGHSQEKMKDGGRTGATSKEAPPATPTPTPAANGDKVVMHDFHFTKEAAPTTPSPTAGPAEVNQIKSTKANASFKEGAPVTPTVGPVGNTNLNSGRTNIEREGVVVTPSPTAGPVPNDGREKQKGTSKTMGDIGREQHPKYVAGRVLSQQGRRLTVQLSNGQTVAVDGSGLNPAPRVGSTVTVTNSRGSWVIVTR